MSKMIAIAWKDIYGTFTDRNLILIMLVTPLALSTIIALALGDAASGGAFRDMPVALVNLDEGDASGQNYGQIYVSAFLPSEEQSEQSTSCEVIIGAPDDTSSVNFTSLDELTDTTLYDSADVARQAVRDGDAVAAIIIPADFSARLAYVPGQPIAEPAQVEVFGDSNRSISASIIRSVVEGITAQIATGQVTIAATVDTWIGSGGSLNIDRELLACGFVPGISTITVQRESLEDDDFNPLVVIGAAQATFFALFTAAGGASNIIEERQNGTMQRMIVSPTLRSHILLGKLIGVFMMVLLQLTFLFFAFTVVGSLLEGELSFIWGTNIAGIVAVVIVTALSVSGVGMMVAAVAKTPDQVNIIGGIIALVMGMLGGAFFPVQALGPLGFITRISIVRWGGEAFTKLSEGNSDILVNLIALLLIGSVLFITSLITFNRRQDI